eukprot:403353651
MESRSSKKASTASSSTKSVTSGEKAFIKFLVDYIVSTNPGDLYTNIQHMSKYMLDNLPPKCEENLYRKQYGNLKDCLLQGKGIMSVFKLDGTCFKFNKHAVVEEAYTQGILTEEAHSKYLEGRESYLLKHLQLMKDNEMNECRKCEQKYYIKANQEGQCYVGQGSHEPLYDFEKDPENVLNCTI